MVKSGIRFFFFFFFCGEGGIKGPICVWGEQKSKTLPKMDDFAIFPSDGEGGEWGQSLRLGAATEYVRK